MRYVRLRLYLFGVLAVLWAAPSWAATYYADITAGADTNNGTSKATPWKHFRGMPTCTNVCLSTLPVAGDNFIFKGGETWPNANFKWSWSWSGTSVSRIYIGVDPTWYTGGSWTRPIFNANGAVMSGNNSFLHISGNYVTVDNIEWTGFISTAGIPFGNNTYINPLAADYVILEHNYFHGFANDASNTYFTIIRGSVQNPTINPGFTIRYNVFSGKDSPPALADPNCTGSCNASATAISGCVDYVMGNVFEYFTTAYAGVTTREIAYNLAYEIRLATDGIAHGNAFESLRDHADGTLFHDNVIYGIRGAFPGIWLIPGTGVTSYAWNNVLADTGVANILNFGDSTPLFSPCCGRVVFVNNTVECGPDTAAASVCADQTWTTEPAAVDTVFKNNHFITSAGNYISGTGRSSIQSNNIVQTRAAALAQGYTFAQAPYKFIPTDAGDATVDTGVDLTADCTIMYTLCADTKYGVVYDDVAHTATLYGRTAATRYPDAAWDVGAYQFDTGAVTVPAAIGTARMMTFAGNTFAIFTWPVGTSANHVAYNIYRCTTSGACTTLVKTITPASALASYSPETRFFDSSLYAAGTYYYSVSDVNIYGEIGAATTPVSITVTGKQ